jgi:hypothetical protein
MRLRGQLQITGVEMTHPARALVTQSAKLFEACDQGAATAAPNRAD